MNSNGFVPRQNCKLLPPEQNRVMAALSTNDITEKVLASGLSAAVDQHDADAVKEEGSTVGRGNHDRQVRMRAEAMLFTYMWISWSYTSFNLFSTFVRIIPIGKSRLPHRLLPDL